MFPLIPNTATTTVPVTGLHLTAIVGTQPGLAAVSGTQPTLAQPVGAP